MTTVPPPTAPPAPPAPVPASIPVATVPLPPPPLLAAPHGTRLEAVVLAVDLAASKIQVQTALGGFDLKTPLPLPVDARLVLQVALTSPNVQLLILAVDGQPPLPGALRPGTPVVPGPATPPDRTPVANPILPVADRIQVGTVIEATLLRAVPLIEPHAPARGTAVASKSPLLDADLPKSFMARAALFGANIGAKLAALPEKWGSALSGLAATRSDQPPAAGPSTSGAVNSAKSLAGLPGSPDRDAPKTILPPGTAVTVRVSALRADAPVAPHPAPASSLAAGSSLAATVVSSTPGSTIVATEIGPVILATAETLAKGQRLLLEFVGSPRTPSTGDDHNSPLFGRGWPALESAITLLKNESPELHRILIGSLLARPDSTLAAGIVLFLSALKAGSLNAWLGENTVRALARGRPELLSRLKDDFRELARVADDPGSGDWRVAVVPFNAQTAIEQLRIMTRREKRNESEESPESTRFVVDVTLSRLGRVQIDGLVRSKEKRLDLVMRTAQPLPAAMREDIRRLFTAATGATGIGGMLSFDAREGGFVEVQAEHLLRGSGAVIA